MTAGAILPTVEPDGQPCPQCAEPLRSDQRYCLNCGRRRSAMRLPFLDIVGPAGPTGAGVAAPAAPPTTAGADRSPVVAFGALVALLLALGIGVIIGQGAGSDAVVARAPAPIVNVAAAPTATTTATAAAVSSDWPAGSVGWTIRLRALPGEASAAEVAQAKTEATTAGATAVGALRSDEFGSLPAGEIVIYSGMFSAKRAATAALRRLRKAFPQAAVVRVAASGEPAAARADADPQAATPVPKKRSGLSTREYQKRSKKLPDEVKSKGTPPPTDGKAPGGGSGEVTEIG